MRDWWLRTVLVVAAPRAVFAALRDDSREDASLRAEPMLVILWLVGIAFVLGTRTAAHLMDDGLRRAERRALGVPRGGLYGRLPPTR